MAPYLPIRQDARGGCIVSSSCCGFLAETGCWADAVVVETAFSGQTAKADACPKCGKHRPIVGEGQ